MITVPALVWQESLDTFRLCGAGARECVVYWCAPIATPGAVDLVIHPEHSASRMSYDVDPAWLNRVGFELAREGRTVLAQVHTHEGIAFHSPTDDGWPLVSTPGFLSLVLPHFALNDVDLRSAYLAELAIDGRFGEVTVNSRMRFVP